MEYPNNAQSGFIPAHGGYRHLISNQKAEIIYDATVYFANRRSKGKNDTGKN